MIALAVALFVTSQITEANGLKQTYQVKDGGFYVDGVRFDTSTIKEPIVAAFADEDLFFVLVDAKGGLHHHENGLLDTQWGLPTLPSTRGPLALPFPVDKLRNGRVAYSQRHKNVLFYEDPQQQQFHWGNAGTTTLWVLSDDGRALLLGDPWLPPDFSREACGPKRGALRMEAVAASASTLMVLGADGSIHTRFYDYDSFGGTPFYGYDYRHVVEEQRLGADPASELQTRRLPAEPWKQEPALHARRMSRAITIAQNGQGNAARALRVVGENSEGTRGTFTKRLRDAAWTFTPGDIVVDERDWLVPAADAEGEAPAVSFSGFSDDRRFFVSTRDFWFHCSPFTMTIALPDRDVDVEIHTVDSWTLFQGNNPRDDDTAMKLLKATIIAQEGDVDVVRSVFGSDAGEPFSHAIVANQHELVMFPVGYPFNVERREQLVLRHDPRVRSRAVVPLRPASRIASDVDDCAQALQQVKEAQKKAQQELALSSALEAALPLGTSVIDVVTIVTGTRYFLDVTRWLTGLELHLPAVLGAQTVAKQRYLTSSHADFAQVTADLERCVEQQKTKTKTQEPSASASPSLSPSPHTAASAAPTR